MELTPRQVEVLRAVVEGHVELGAPVGSKWIAEQRSLGVKPSTVRAELARLEEGGLLQHPHTSSGRVPTDHGYRVYVDDMLAEGRLPAPRGKVQLEVARREVDAAMRSATEQLSQVTNLLAIVSAPPIAGTTVRHVDVLLLQPQVAMVVIITSTGGVTKRVVSYHRPVDPGLVDWAASYLNETLAGMGVGARMAHAKLADTSLSQAEGAFLATLAPAFTELEETAQEDLYVGGASRLLSEDRFQELSQLGDLMTALERRVALLRVVRHALDVPSVFLRIGHEIEAPELQGLSIVSAGYGLAGRPLGAIGVLGPVRMDYGTAIAAVRQAADELSRFVDGVYTER